VTITSPRGTTLDVSAQLGLDQLGSITSAPEAELGTLAHGDMAMVLDNSIGEVEAFLEGAGPSDTYDVTLSRERADGSEWDRMFGGVLDLPYSLSYDDMARTAHVVAYSYSKKLERTPADTIKRTLTSKTASINIDTSTLAFISGETADIEIGDVVRLNDGQTTEEFTIARINDSVYCDVMEPASRAFSGVFAEVVTPYRHDMGPKALLQLVADESINGEFNDLDLGNPLSDFPIATPLSQAGLNLNGMPLSIVQDYSAPNPLISASFAIAYGTKRKTITSPVGTWIDAATSNACQYDWTPYLYVKPTTILSNAGYGSSYDTGYLAPDHTNGYRYNVQPTATGTALFRNGVTLGDWMPVTSLFVDVYCCEYEPTLNRVYLCYYDKGNATTQKIRRYDPGVGFIDVSASGIGGHFRTVRYLGSTLLMMVDIYTNDLWFWTNLNSGTVAKPSRIIRWVDAVDPRRSTSDVVLHWTARTWGVGPLIGGQPSALWFSFMFVRDSKTFMAIYDASGTLNDWHLVATYPVASAGPFYAAAGGSNSARLPKRHAFQTVFKDATGEEFSIGYSAGQWFVMATHYAGVIRYADFKDASCAKAARDIAVILDSVVDFDAFGVMTIRNRKALGSGDPVMDLGTPLTCTRYPISENYRSSVTVKGTDSSGAAISETVGNTGDSARRLTISSDLITTPGMALACAMTTLEFVSQIREQRNVTVLDDGTPLAVFDRVTMAGKTWLIYKLETDLEQQIHTMTLLELQL